MNCQNRWAGTRKTGWNRRSNKFHVWHFFLLWQHWKIDILWRSIRYTAFILQIKYYNYSYACTDSGRTLAYSINWNEKMNISWHTNTWFVKYNRHAFRVWIVTLCHNGFVNLNVGGQFYRYKWYQVKHLWYLYQVIQYFPLSNQFIIQ